MIAPDTVLSELLQQMGGQQPVTKADLARVIYAVRDACREAGRDGRMPSAALHVIEWCAIGAVTALLSPGVGG